MLTNESSSRQTYVSIIGGKFTVKAKEGDEGAVKRTKKTGEDVWEKQYEKVSGTITNFVKESFSYNGQDLENLRITLEDVTESYVVSISLDSSLATQFMKRFEGIDLNKEVVFMTGKFEDKASKKTVSFFSVYQDGKKLPSNYTKENPNGMPDMKVVKLKGKDTYDDFDQKQFLLERCLAHFHKDDKGAQRQPEPAHDDNDSLPF